MKQEINVKSVRKIKVFYNGGKEGEERFFDKGVRCENRHRCFDIHLDYPIRSCRNSNTMIVENKSIISILLEN